MIVGICKFRLHIAGSHSLKEKRHVLRKLKDNIRNKFPVSIAEVDEHDYWQSAVIGLSIVGKDKKFVDSEINKVLNAVKQMYLAEIVDEEVEIISF